MKTKEYCMTRFFGHGQSILQVFETSIALSMVKNVKSQFFQTLLVPISWTLAIWYMSLEGQSCFLHTYVERKAEETEDGESGEMRLKEKFVQMEYK